MAHQKPLLSAEDLFVTQPAVTLQIKALESDLGMRLFDRAGSRIALTRQGSVLLNYANKIAKLVAEAEGELGTSEGHVSGDLLLGFRRRLHNMFGHDLL